MNPGPVCLISGCLPLRVGMGRNHRIFKGVGFQKWRHVWEEDNSSFSTFKCIYTGEIRLYFIISHCGTDEIASWSEWIWHSWISMMFLVADCNNAPSEHIIIITLKFNHVSPQKQTGSASCLRGFLSGLQYTSTKLMPWWMLSRLDWHPFPRNRSHVCSTAGSETMICMGTPRAIRGRKGIRLETTWK